MGAWGPAVFSDDTACDVRSDYRELLEDQVPDDDAARQVIASYSHLDADEEHVLWLALAAAQSKLGRLDDDVKARALDVIDTGRGLQLWEEAGPKELAKRNAALSKLREQLTGPQPARKTVRRPWRHVTDLERGDVLAFTASNGQMALLRVARVDDHRVGVAPILEWLDWRGKSAPSGWRLRRLKVRVEPHSLASPGHTAFRVAKHRQRDADWRESGFSIVAKTPAQARDGDVEARSYTAWSGLHTILERELTK
jgi:hypothetical protein